MKTALLIIDVQNDYFPNGKMELKDTRPVSLKIKELLELCRNKSVPVIHVQHISVKPGSTFFLPGTFGAEIHDNVRPLKNEKIIIKNYPNSFRNTELQAHLMENHISKLIITGMMTHMCIDTSVRAAFDLGYECIVAGDCCTTRDLSLNGQTVPAENVQDSFLAALNGVFSKVLTKDEVAKLLN